MRLQHIADAAFVSVGHLAYYFKNKDGIIDALYEQLKLEQELLLSEFRVVPLFEDIQRLLISLFRLQKQYLFFYLDTLEIIRAYPDIKQKHALHISWKLQQIDLMLHFNISRGAFKPFVQADYLKETAWLFNAAIDNWMYSRKLTGLESSDEQAFLHSIWASLYPLFTDMGHREFSQINIHS